MTKTRASTVLVFAVLTFASIAVSDVTYQEHRILRASDTAAFNAFGFSVSVSGTTAAIGAPYLTSENPEEAVYIFERSSNGDWVEEARLQPFDLENPEIFSYSVALDGDTLVVGAFEEDLNEITSGTAYIYERVGSNWTEVAEIAGDDSSFGDRFGFSVAISENTIVVGAPAHDESSGAAYVFVRNGSAWEQQAKLTADDGVTFHSFGSSVSIDADTVVAGAPVGLSPDNFGATYIFVRDGNDAWTHQQKLEASDGASNDIFGTSVSISGETVVVGASQDGDLGDLSGSAYVFERANSLWTEQAKLLPRDGETRDGFGSAVSMSGSTALIGSPFDDDNGDDYGAAYVFRRIGSQWQEGEKLFGSDCSECLGGAQFASSVAIDGARAVIGDFRIYDTGRIAGSASVFEVAISELLSLPDVNADGIDDIAVFRKGSILVEIRSGANGSLLKTISFLNDDFVPVDAAVLPDADGNGVQELAILGSRNSDGRITVEMRNVSGVQAPRTVWFAINHSPVALAIVDSDADNNGIIELAVLSRRNSDGRGLVEVKNAFGPTNTNSLWAGSGLTSTHVAVVSDKDDNGVDEIAILSTRDTDGRIVAEIKNAAGNTLPTTVWFMPGNTAIDMTAIADKDNNGVPEIAVLSSRISDGRNVVEIKNAFGPTAPSAVWFAAGYTATDVTQISDADNNGVPEVAVLSTRNSDGRILVEVKNAFGATNPNSIWYSAGFSAQGLARMADSDGNSIDEALVLMIRDSDGRILVQGRNAAGNQSPTDYWFSP